MSEQLREELRASVLNGDLLFMPSPEVRSEAVRFIRPRSDTLTFVSIEHGSGLHGDGRMKGIGVAKSFVDYIRETTPYSS